MNEALSIKTERVDDIPLLLAHMQRMNLVELLDQHVPKHGNRVGLSLGWVSSLWLTHVLSQADHRRNHVQAWAEQRVETLRGWSQATLDVRDLSDDRLADVLRDLSDDTRWRELEQDLAGQLFRVYDLAASCVRLDSTTASSDGAVSEEGLLQVGHRKDHRPDVPQRKVMLATLDPLGLPLATEVLSGQRADAPLSLPAIARVRTSLQKPGLLSVGDCKRGALSTRASIQAQGDFSLGPLSALPVPADLLESLVETALSSGQPLVKVERTQADGHTHGIAQGDERVETVTAQLDGVACRWTERRVLVQSMAAKLAADQALHTRLQQAQHALSERVMRRQGKAVLSDRTAVEQAVRASRDRPATVRITRHLHMSRHVQTEALRKASEQLGWRVYATNHAAEHLPLTQAVEASRDEFLVERTFGRLKGHPLSLTPMSVERDDHATGLVRLLSIAVRVWTLLEFVVRRQLAQQGASLAGLSAGNPKRATTRPTTERLLEACQGIFLTILGEPHQTRRHLTALSALQQHVLALLEFSPTLSSHLSEDSSEPP